LRKDGHNYFTDYNIGGFKLFLYTKFFDTNESQEEDVRGKEGHEVAEFPLGG